MKQAFVAPLLNEYGTPYGAVAYSFPNTEGIELVHRLDESAFLSEAGDVWCQRSVYACASLDDAISLLRKHMAEEDSIR